ncbi:MAG: translation initiation factor IF-2 [Candidatus Niyogibacteria bacterium]|nr:translation initiation factor IF-2 [Candidatus Niyogibacteria bacterium]
MSTEQKKNLIRQNLPSVNLSGKISRPPVVVVVGHIDHGKTKLLDYIRKSNIAEKESGGITQHIGAYEAVINTKDGRTEKITFLDTPGHEAFSQIRSRGAKAADVAILVVAADEGVKPQTEESIKVLKDANLPFVVAINKIDKEGADSEKVKKELAEREILVESWGGKVPAVEISAKQGTGVKELLETIILLAQLEELKADPRIPAKGVVIESSLEPKRGNAATLLIQDGTLKIGNFVAAGNAISSVRVFEDFLGHSLKEASFSSPVRVVGFDYLPPAGTVFSAFLSKKEAEKFSAKEKISKDFLKEKEKKIIKEAPAASLIIVPVILKADTSGSLEALEKEAKKFDSEKLKIKILKSGTGPISEDDFKVALSAPETIILSFRAGLDEKIIELLSRRGVIFKNFEIIYEASDWLKEQLEKKLPLEIERTEIGQAKILKLFKKSGQKQVIGGKIIDGLVKNEARFEIIRNEHKIGEGRIIELQQAKIKTKEAAKGSEFGILADAEISIEPGDILRFFEEKTIKQTL